MSDFLTRIQVHSDKFKSIDGAWFRAFNFGNWDYQASNADAGWGAWSALTGWTQSWIVTTQVLIEQNNSLWDVMSGLEIDQDQFNNILNKMLEFGTGSIPISY